MKFRISVDDGAYSDLRLSDLCIKYGVELIVYLPVEWRSLAYSKGYEPLSYNEAFKLSERHEIGSHTVTHRHLTDLPQDEILREVEDSKNMLEKLFNQPIAKFAPPRGYTNNFIDHCVHDTYEEQRLTKGDHLVHIHPDSGANDNKPWQECVNENTTEIWTHGWELDKFDLWGELEDFLKENV